MDSIYTNGTYLRNNPVWHADDSAWKAGHVATMLERHALAPQSVCEIGCGAGEFLRALSISDADKEKIAHGNAERLLRL